MLREVPLRGLRIQLEHMTHDPDSGRSLQPNFPDEDISLFGVNGDLTQSRIAKTMYKTES